MDTHFLPVLVGPTAVGKTELSIRLAEALGAEILSADSMQIYKYMDIGTAKPTPAERRGIPHHLLDLVTPDQPFSVAEYQKSFQSVEKAVRARNRIPLVTGGTGLYIRAVTRQFRIPAPPADPQLRKELQERLEQEGNQRLHDELRRVDPAAAQRIHVNDGRRIIRALEVFIGSGKPFSTWLEDAQQPINSGTVMIGLNRDRNELYQRIDLRVEQMLRRGLLDEVKMLLDRGYSPELTSMQGLGYKELVPVIQGTVSLEDAVELLKRRTRNYAKRQLTWFRSEPVVWFELKDNEEDLTVQKILSFLEGKSRYLGE
ncbi:MAG TPA: tRNA (adenosine(37)-N6)-dimethylallyltransferase MiaA [Firmicutes bacterium]|nr:tRNA (adenosine(37)-N6)-dimethylallyltransferase MiaA [Bacillota bacterium]HOQ24052.1 tRNA (adenosine(37)-N6)-dimethylallyltransferase MiaA [Bacillota bacterium]HPT67545.1 tRNA (adenosine(37)-N6)-dimethylallyltransferase MiaA [Bacillota bacterium]